MIAAISHSLQQSDGRAECRRRVAGPSALSTNGSGGFGIDLKSGKETGWTYAPHRDFQLYRDAGGRGSRPLRRAVGL